ncbi:MAG: GTP-binding protein YchF [Candidatus Moranbacteria bacterium GW2011_GWC1_45_18]|nr:MAG: GTP-binding protein YchF [Candidatus Moranbacteria bacterium GW2011_GWC2_40_12]KKT34143.1 MAG: GTP-binding protein YchF [Candidatus Moranbacteria bacterium GW2011_GWF2_44_10]KKU00645.1 MAG: GTP-binding protein YchF [Candidatus Moranbacteria bacterium GW2011_GWC1_45_18]OGI40461.1 MAG: redox-regulated ATPase YchF [Candidatus Moranbacteria bacterium RIFOXYB1_FULL_44_23]OGI42566.1 MAG: redox-regulated ATPase YchF [Candidatus Moranbacteria bacterium RIFOXYD1_FULL_44_9]HBB36727.1 redox-regul
MSLKVGIVGLPNVGKSTLFKALTKNPVDIANYPFCTIEPNVGIVKVPDERLEKLAKMSKSAKVVPTVIEFVDIAGLVKGAAEGEGLGNKFLAHIREVDAIVQVVRVFEDKNITHIHDKIDPQNDIEIINTELILADLDTVSKRIVKLEKEARGQNKEAIAALGVAKKIKIILDEGKLARDLKLSAEDMALVKDMQLLTWKPIFYVLNIHEKNTLELSSRVSSRVNSVAVDIKIEEELSQMSANESAELGMKSNLDKLILKSYEVLNLITFLTTGEDETRAWTVKYDSTAPEAGRAIHSDFEEKFIRADVINWQKLLEAGSWAKARELGTLRTEGKDYIVKDGDVIEFKI